MICVVCGGAGAVLYDNPRFLEKLHRGLGFWPQLFYTKSLDGRPMSGYFDYCLFCHPEKFELFTEKPE